jgi:nucleotide-binding universal stress UspA family protein
MTMNNILVPIDLSEATPHVLAAAKAQAREHAARLWIIHVAEPDPGFVGFEAGPPAVRDHVARNLWREHRELNEIAAQLRAEGFDATPRLLRGSTVDTILDQAAEHAANLIVVGTHGRGLAYQLLLGSVSGSVMRRASCPVLLVPVRRTGTDTGDRIPA